MLRKNSLGFIKFGRKVITKNKSLVEDVLKLQETVANK